MISSNTNSHSAEVSLELLIGMRKIPLAQAAHDFGIATIPVEIPVCHGVVVMSVDGCVERFSVFLPEGCGPGKTKFPWRTGSAENAGQI
ncbi:MAG: hypothetical protein Q8M16_12680 [Pirellulaceae bacterium]|nr:hypothetical protein [Pirellulaceae bacterium]